MTNEPVQGPFVEDDLPRKRIDAIVAELKFLADFARKGKAETKEELELRVAGLVEDATELVLVLKTIYHVFEARPEMIDTSRKWCETLEKRTAVALGVGDGRGQLFVYGDHESIKACQEKLFRMEKAEAALAEAVEVMRALRQYKRAWETWQLGRRIDAFLAQHGGHGNMPDTPRV